MPLPGAEVAAGASSSVEVSVGARITPVSSDDRSLEDAFGTDPELDLYLLDPKAMQVLFVDSSDSRHSY